MKEKIANPMVCVDAAIGVPKGHPQKLGLLIRTCKLPGKSGETQRVEEAFFLLDQSQVSELANTLRNAAENWDLLGFARYSLAAETIK